MAKFRLVSSKSFFYFPIPLLSATLEWQYQNQEDLTMDQDSQIFDKYPNDSGNLPIASTSTLSNIHLSYPSATSDVKVQAPTTSQPRQLLKDRLYVGNLHPSVDESVVVYQPCVYVLRVCTQIHLITSVLEIRQDIQARLSIL